MGLRAFWAIKTCIIETHSLEVLREEIYFSPVSRFDGHPDDSGRTRGWGFPNKVITLCTVLCLVLVSRLHSSVFLYLFDRDGAAHQTDWARLRPVTGHSRGVIREPQACVRAGRSRSEIQPQRALGCSFVPQRQPWGAAQKLWRGLIRLAAGSRLSSPSSPTHPSLAACRGATPRLVSGLARGVSSARERTRPFLKKKKKKWGGGEQLVSFGGARRALSGKPDLESGGQPSSDFAPLAPPWPPSSTSRFA